MPLVTPEAADFREYVMTELRDPEGVHHEFSQGLHGIKIEMGLIVPGSPEYEQWVDLNTIAIKKLHPQDLPNVLLGIDSGTNGVVRSIAEQLNHGVRALKTRKISKNQVELDEEALAYLMSKQDLTVKIIEDVATRGTASASAVLACRATGVKVADVLNTVERTGKLVRLDEIGAEHRSILDIPEQDYTKEECNTEPAGYCARGWKLIPHGSET